AVRAQLLQVQLARPQAGLLAQFPARGRVEALVPLDEAARQRQPAEERLGPALDHEDLQRVVPHCQHGEVDRDRGVGSPVGHSSPSIEFVVLTITQRPPYGPRCLLLVGVTRSGPDTEGGDFWMETHVILTHLISVLAFWLG